MMAGLATWWRARTLREQRLLGFAGLLLTGMVLWLGVARPLNRTLDSVRERHALALRALGEALAQADAIRKLQQAPRATPAAPLLPLLRRSAEEAGFGAVRVAPEGPGAVRLVIGAARPQVVFGWLITLARRQGLVVHELKARANSDATIALEASLRVRGR
jgi:type II secretory pathway component PulM